MNARLAACWLAMAAFAAQADEPLRTIAFGSCAHQGRVQHFWDPILAHAPQAFIFLGDNIYADTENMDLLKQEYDFLGRKPGFQKLRASATILATWDDHDYGENDAGAEYPERAASRAIFLDFWQVPADSPRRKHEGVYDAQVIGPPGKRVQVILLDTRYFRSPLEKLPERPKDDGPYTMTRDPNATLLGEAQWSWLEEQLKVPAELRILASSIQVVAQDHHWEKWMNFPEERARLLRLLWATKANGVVVISGDRHHGEISCLKDGPPYPLYDITSSGLNMGRPGPIKEPNRYRLGEVVATNNFGLVTIDWDASDPVVQLELRDTQDASHSAVKFPLSALRP